MRYLLMGICLFGASFIAQGAPTDADYSVDKSIWVNKAIITMYTINHQNLLPQQKKMATYFTSNGWINYSQALNKSNVLKQIKQQGYDVRAVATAPPSISAKRAHVWDAQMPILVEYTNSKQHFKQHLLVQLTFSDNTSNQRTQTYAIERFVSQEKTPKCPCPLPVNVKS